jgi:hypothetical protein
MSIPPFLLNAGLAIEYACEHSFTSVTFRTGVQQYVSTRWETLLPAVCAIVGTVIVSILFCCLGKGSCKSCMPRVGWRVATAVMAVLLTVTGSFVVVECSAERGVLAGTYYTLEGPSGLGYFLQSTGQQAQRLIDLGTQYNFPDVPALATRVNSLILVGNRDYPVVEWAGWTASITVVTLCCLGALLCFVAGLVALFGEKKCARIVFAVLGACAFVAMGLAASSAFVGGVFLSDVRHLAAQPDAPSQLNCPSQAEFQPVIDEIVQWNKSVASTAQQHADATTAVGIIESFINCAAFGVFLNTTGLGADLRERYNPLLYSLIMLQGVLAALLLVLYVFVIGMGSDALYVEKQFEYEQLPNPLAYQKTLN